MVAHVPILAAYFYAVQPLRRCSVPEIGGSSSVNQMVLFGGGEDSAENINYCCYATLINRFSFIY